MAVLLFLLISVCSVTSSFACFCMPEHPQKQFCNAGGFVLRAKVVGPPIRAAMPNRSGNYQVYWLRITSIFKGHANVQSKSLTKLYTPSQISSCRVRLQPSTEYLLFGKILGGNLYTSFCNFHQKWTAVTPEQRTGVEMQYSQGCKCKIGFCFANCGGLLSGCDGYDPHWRCRAKYHRCDSYRDRNGVEKCGWRGRGQGLFQQCARQGYGFPWVTKQFSKPFSFFFLPSNSNTFCDQTRMYHVLWIQNDYLIRETKTWTFDPHVIKSCTLKSRQICVPARLKRLNTAKEK